MRGLEMPADTAAQVVEGALARRLLVNRTAGDVVRMLPPLTVSDAEIDKAVGMLAEVLDTLQSGESDV
jgi:acetylornithine aminotransferase